MTLPERLALRTGSTNNALLEALILDSQNAIMDYTHRSTLTERFDGIVIELATIYYNRIGTEGESSRNEGGVSVSYDDMPNSIETRLKKYVLLKQVGMANANS